MDKFNKLLDSRDVDLIYIFIEGIKPIEKKTHFKNNYLFKKQMFGQKDKVGCDLTITIWY